MCILNILIWLAIGAGILGVAYSIHTTRQKARAAAREETFRKKTPEPKKPSDLLYEAIRDWIRAEQPRKMYTAKRKKDGYNGPYYMTGKITVTIATASGSKLTIPTEELFYVRTRDDIFYHVDACETEVKVFRDENEILFTYEQRKKLGLEIGRLFKRSHEAVKAETLAANEVVCAEVLNDMNLSPGAV